ncbi:MAG: gamma carbonic anhydrase family protein [Clostridiaceae bacterium]|nr:gamma carbonic anhydrase family protein [Clostridiaceae bacterium]
MIHKFRGIVPQVHKSCFVAESAQIIGEAVLKQDASVWFGAVVRADDNKINIGKGSNIQDNCILHSSIKEGNIVIGEKVTVGHGAILHGCKINNNCLIGMGAIILDGAEIGENTIIGAGSLVTSNKNIPAGVLCLGSPARVIRELTEEEIQAIADSAKHYIDIISEYI